MKIAFWLLIGSWIGCGLTLFALALCGAATRRCSPHHCPDRGKPLSADNDLITAPMQYSSKSEVTTITTNDGVTPTYLN